MIYFVPDVVFGQWLRCGLLNSLDRGRFARPVDNLGQVAVPISELFYAMFQFVLYQYNLL